MAEPLSFVASVSAVASLAGNVVTKGYQYLRAVKNCSDDVRSLMAEVNVLCGILERLVVLLQGSRSGLNGASTIEVHDSEEDTENNVSMESEDEAQVPNQALQPPDFIYECQKTLFEIQNILNKFGRAKSQASESANKATRFSLSRLQRLEPKDLKWPLTKSKTLQLIEALERHKSTCTMALAKDGLVGVHAVLEQTKLSNRHLADLKAKQQKMLELCITQEEGKLSVDQLLNLPSLLQHSVSSYLCS